MRIKTALPRHSCAGRNRVCKINPVKQVIKDNTASTHYFFESQTHSLKLEHTNLKQ